jgi:hypothetical protein
VLIDYENVYWSLKNNYGFSLEPGMLVDGVRNLIGRQGHVVLMLAYADFDHPEFKGLQTELQRRSVEPRHVYSVNSEEDRRKNAADIELSLDALELVYTRLDIDYYCLVCGDRDVIQVIKKLHTRRKQVHVIGVERTTSKDLKQFADAFSSVERILGIEEMTAKAGETITPDLAFLIKKVNCLEQSRMAFVGLKLVTTRVLASLRDPQSVVSQAISEGILETYKVPNPSNNDFPTTACRLNRAHPFVEAILDTKEAKGTEPFAS